MSHAVFPANVVENQEALAIDDLLPGAEMLGYGFNIFGDYSFDSALRPLLTLGTPSPWNAPSGKVYALPANVNTPGGSHSSAQASTFASSQEFNSYFQASASVSGSVGAFGGSFSASYSLDQQNNRDFSWALVESDFYAWNVQMQYSAQIVRPDVLSDSDWSNLPQTFDSTDPNNVLAFYRFFQKFGTHFISSVSAGGTLYYYYSVSQSAQYTGSQISLSASAEYQALISSSQVQASGYWSQTAGGWTSNRQSHAETSPATTGVVNWVDPPAGSYDSNNSFAQWQDQVLNFPTRSDFSLTPIWALFSGSQFTALQQAYAAYANNRISVEVGMGHQATIIVNGLPIAPDNGYPPSGQPAWQIVVLDPRTLVTRLSRQYLVPLGPDLDSSYDKMVADVTPSLNGNQHILLAATSFMDLNSSPTTPWYAIVKSSGGGPGLDSWYASNDHNCVPYPVDTALYGLIGMGTPILGTEGFSKPAFAGEPPSFTLNALLLPLTGGGGFSAIPYQTR